MRNLYPSLAAKVMDQHSARDMMMKAMILRMRMEHLSPPSVCGRWLSSCLSGLVQSPSLRTYTKEFPRDIGLVLGIHRWIGHLMHHCDDGGDQD